MSRRLLPILLVLLLGALALPAAAVTYGQPDGEDHPYVGMIFFYVPDDYDARFDDPGVWYSCSGTLMSPTVFLTAGHCAYGIGQDGTSTLNETDLGSGGNDVWVTFGTSHSLDGLPLSSDYGRDENQQRYADRVIWLNDPDNGWVRGTSYPHPEYGYGFPNTRDIGVIVLGSPVSKDEYGALPNLGYLDALAVRRGQQRPSLMVQTVGYGMLSVKPVYDPNVYDERYAATSRILNLRSALTDGYNLQTSNNPSDANGAGGSCFGDSGGPVFGGVDSNVVVAIVSFGLNSNCKGVDFAYRADISITQDFLARFGVAP